jgi:beta-lactamase superfamily II metal-dependent hydrolase
MKLEIFDVEHGGCALLTCDNGTRLMIDCGHNATTGWYPGDHLVQHGIQYLDVLANTNYDQDHISGYRNLRNRVNIGAIWRNTSVTPQTIHRLKSDVGTVSPEMNVFIADINGAAFGPPGAGEPMQFPSVEYCLHRNAYPAFDDENNLSMLVRLTINGLTFLFTGDIETAGWRMLLATDPALRAAAARIDVLVASHHGRANGVCPELFDDHGCAPKIVVISDDYMQYDTQQTTAYYASKCSGITGFRGQGARKVLTTRKDGTLTFTWDGNFCGVN